MEYPRWLRIVVWPETVGDMSEPTIPEAPGSEFRSAFVHMRLMGYPEDRFPTWFTEKISEEERQTAERTTQAPMEAPINDQPQWVVHFGPDQLSQPHWYYGTAANYAGSRAQALASHAQMYLRSNIPLREDIQNARHRRFPAPPSPEACPLSHFNSHSCSVMENEDLLEPVLAQMALQRSRVMEWVAENSARRTWSTDDEGETS